MVTTLQQHEESSASAHSFLVISQLLNAAAIFVVVWVDERLCG
jgi:hypothetical protein